MTSKPPSSSLNVYQRFSQACKIIGSQAWVKDMSNAQFKSIPIDAMRKGVREACVQAGLVHVGPFDMEYTREHTDRTFRWFGSCRFAYFSIDDPSDRLEFEIIGEAMDNGDKGAGKLVSNWIKNHYKAVFDIGEQGKDDVDHYSNEEIYEEADRIEARRKKSQAKARDDDTLMDKPIETVMKCVRDWKDDMQTEDIIKAAIEVKGTFDQWDEKQWRRVYMACVRTFQKNGGRIQ